MPLPILCRGRAAFPRRLSALKELHDQGARGEEEVTRHPSHEPDPRVEAHGEAQGDKIGSCVLKIVRLRIAQCDRTELQVRRRNERGSRE